MRARGHHPRAEGACPAPGANGEPAARMEQVGGFAEGRRLIPWRAAWDGGGPHLIRIFQGRSTMTMKRRTFFLSVGAAAATGLAAPAVGQRARVLRFVPTVDLSSLDPHWSTSQAVQSHGYYVFDTLFGVNARQEPRPQMAEGHVLEDNGRTALIRLRDGLRFHDGEPVLARDCAASLKRWSARDVFGQTAALFVEDWGAADDRTVRIRLKRPFGLLIDALAKPNGQVPFIMPERLAKTDPNRQVSEMVGSGPYRFIRDEFLQGSRAVYQRFDGYRPRQEKAEWLSGGKVAHIERIEWRILPDPSTVAAALQKQEVDWWEQVPPDMLPLLRQMGHLRVHNTNPVGYYGILRFNHLHPPFNNLAVRRAVALGLPQEDYMRAVAGNEEDLFTSCKALFPCSTRYGEEIGTDTFRSDLAAARAALQASGYNGEKVVVLNPADLPSLAPFGHVSFDYFRKLGLNVELASVDWGTLVQRRISKEPVEKGGWSVFHARLFGTSIAHPAISSIIRGLGTKGWPGWFDSAEVERLTEAWLTAPDDAGRDQLARAIHREVIDTLPSLPLGRFFVNSASRKDLKGMLDGTSPVPWNLEWA
jgi:peptide/nickel transport system substrate-binding protein